MLQSMNELEHEATEFMVSVKLGIKRYMAPTAEYSKYNCDSDSDTYTLAKVM